MPYLSVVIPTYNRRDILMKTLEGYRSQSVFPDSAEILVVDDGSTDGTADAVHRFIPASPIPVRYLCQQNKGAAAARNWGMREAQGSVLFFTDDDIVPSSTLLSEHLTWHKKFSAKYFAMLGRVVWSPSLNPTPYMEWLGNYGALFGFARLVPGQQVGFEFFYSCNVSLKREFILENGVFDEHFSGSGYEDTELSYRLVQKGLRIVYNPAALGYHNKSMSYAESCRRQEGVFASKSRFATTAASTQLESDLEQAKPPTLKRRLMLQLAKILGPLLAPLTVLFDTQVPLPRVVYSVVYFFYVAPRAQVKFERKRRQQVEAKAT